MTRFKLALFALILVGLGFTTCKSEVDFSGQDQTRRYNIRILPVQNGVLSLSTTSALSGERVKIYVNPAPGYKVKDDSVEYRLPKATNKDFGPVRKPSYYWEIGMPAADVEVRAIFEQLEGSDSRRTVSIDNNIKNGKVVSDVTLAFSGDSVTLFDIPNSGYVLKEGTLKVLDAAATPPTPITSITIPAKPPYTFVLPDQNVIITAEFETGNLSQMLENARNYLKAGQYDAAAEFLAQAYQKRGSAANQDDLNEVLFYYSFVKLGDILLSPTVRTLLGQGSLRMDIVPATLDDWICDMYFSGWQGWEGEQWHTKWRGLDYGGQDRAYYNNKQYDVSERAAVLWAPRPDLVTEDRVLPKLQDRFDLGTTGNIDSTGGVGGWGKSFPDTALAQGSNPASPVKFANLMFWLLLIKNRDTGFNDLLYRIENLLFGKAFEDAAKIAALVPVGYQDVPLYDNLVNCFELGKYYGSPNPAYDSAQDPGLTNLPYTVGDVTVGRAELDYVFGALRMVKAAVQFLQAYDWTIFLQPYLLGDQLGPGDGLDQILNQIFKIVEGGSERYRGYWENSIVRGRTLPFFNSLLNNRFSANLSTAKSQFSNGLTMINRSMDYWHGSSGSFSASGKTNYVWAKNAFVQAKTAIDTNGNFDFPKKLPKPGESWPTLGSGEYAVNVQEFFKVGAFNLTNLFTIEPGSGRRPPAMFRIPWYATNIDSETGAMSFELLPLEATQVTALIPDDDRVDMHNKGDNFGEPGEEGLRFGLYSFEINTSNLRKIFPQGFEQEKYDTDRGGDKAYLYQVFPTIPLWPERPTYLSGPGNNNNRSAQYLYRYFH